MRESVLGQYQAACQDGVCAFPFCPFWWTVLLSTRGGSAKGDRRSASAFVGDCMFREVWPNQQAEKCIPVDHSTVRSTLGCAYRTTNLLYACVAVYLDG